MKKGELLLNWMKEPVAVLLCNKSNKVFWLQRDKQSLTTKQMKALFFSEEGLQGADLRGVKLKDADLINANLRGANLTGADLRDANLRGADLEGAILRHANLIGADLRNADLKDAILRDAYHSKSTHWPDGFDKSRLSS